MGTKSALTVINDRAAGVQLSRREMVRRLAAGAAWPLVAASHPIRELLRHDAVLEAVEKLAAADWKRLVLRARQNGRLVGIRGSIVPGSTEAQGERFIDSLPRADASRRRKG